ncbi:TPA: cysteine desulfurase [Candidatus Gracilibacteria bacterium]|nr:cysteine desulfurase [Candidatus Gracilibacteria bacterium]HIQ57296.1 cysteine desulfurase [Candidatus Gracilibacteria bacterium]
MYLDHSATTPLDKNVLEEMMPYLTNHFGNASALYSQGQKAKKALDSARFTIAENIDANLDEIIFTSGATESNNLVIKGVVENFENKNVDNNIKPIIISTNIEHASILEVLKNLESQKRVKLLFLEVDEYGIVSVENFKEILEKLQKEGAIKNLVLVSCMAVNNEIGTIQPVSRVGRICRKQNIIFHIDAVQAFGKIKTSVEDWKCDLMSLSAHKCYGPKGSGVLYVKEGTEMNAQIIGGGQERSYRAGTENIANIVGMVAAFKISEKQREEEQKTYEELQIFAKNYIEKNIDFALWNGVEIGEFRVKNNINFSFSNSEKNIEISGESLLMRLDLQRVSISLGSACSAGMVAESHVLRAIGRTKIEAKTGVRITFGRSTNKEDLEIALAKIVKAVHALKK